MVTELTPDTFDKFVDSNKWVLIDCWAPWCGPCRRMGPIVDEIAEDLKGKVAVAKLNTDDAQEIAIRFGIQAIPTLLFFKDQVLVHQSVGLKPKEEILDAFQKLGL